MASATIPPAGKGWVYVLHLSDRLGHAQHYTGWAENVERRLWEHRAGLGAKFTRAAVRRGISLYLAATWPGGRDLERALKLWHGGNKYCPICQECHPMQPTPSTPVTLWDD